MANALNVEPNKLLETLKATVFQKATNEELLALVVVANTYGLNPLLKEVYAFPAKGGGIVPVVSIDGWISMTNRQPNLDGIEFEMPEDGSSCTCIIHLKGRSKPVKVTEYLSECSRQTEPWKAMPKRMLRHKALIQCARIAFGFSGIQDEDEAKVTAAIDITPKPRLATATSEPINPFPSAREIVADEPADEIPMEDPVKTPQSLLRIAVSDFGCPESLFVETYRKQSKKLVKDAVLISDLSDEACSAALAEIDMLLSLTEAGK
jgi:phage recombination protein Bet